MNALKCAKLTTSFGEFAYTDDIGNIGIYISEDRARAANHLPGAFAKTKKATNILRPAIDVSFLATTYEDFLATALSALEKKKK